MRLQICSDYRKAAPHLMRQSAIFRGKAFNTIVRLQIPQSLSQRSKRGRDRAQSASLNDDLILHRAIKSIAAIETPTQSSIDHEPV
jgi:hypothetical protein